MRITLHIAALGFFAFLSATIASRAGSISILPVADTTLSENYYNNNFGAVPFVNAGTTQNRTKNRGLFQFDVAGALPAHSQIRQASLVLEVRHTPADGFAFADFALHRMLQPWGEGGQTTPTNIINVGTSAPAVTNEATWYYRFAFTTNSWTAPGGAPTNDYVADISSSQTVYGIADSPYTFASTSLMVGDVQSWLDDAANNFGWMLICEAEETPFTARRFASREDAGFAPQLQIDYVAPPRVESATRNGDQFALHFVTEPDQSYIVEFASGLAATNTWTTLTNIPPLGDTISLVVTDTSTSAQRFYRLRTE